MIAAVLSILCALALVVALIFRHCKKREVTADEELMLTFKDLEDITAKTSSPPRVTRIDVGPEADHFLKAKFGPPKVDVPDSEINLYGIPVYRSEWLGSYVIIQYSDGSIEPVRLC